MLARNDSIVPDAFAKRIKRMGIVTPWTIRLSPSRRT